MSLPLTPASLRAASIAAALSAFTTFLLWLLPRLYDAPQGFDAIVRLHENPYYMGRLWVNFVHIFLALAGYGAVAALLWRRAPGLAGFGMMAFLLWGFAELIGVSTNIFAVNYTWRAQFLAASAETQAQLKVLLLWFPAAWDALFFVLLTGFLIGTTCFGFAALRGPGLQRWVGVLFLLATPLTVGIMLGGYAGFTTLDTVTGWIYPILQPVSRGLLAVWLWRVATGREGIDP